MCCRAEITTKMIDFRIFSIFCEFYGFWVFLFGRVGGVRGGGFKNCFFDVFRNRSKKWLCLQPQTLFFTFSKLFDLGGHFQSFHFPIIKDFLPKS